MACMDWWTTCLVSGWGRQRHAFGSATAYANSMPIRSSRGLEITITCLLCLYKFLIDYFFLRSSAVRLGVGVLLPSRLLHVILPFNEKHVHMFIVYTFRKWRICCSVTLSVSVWTAAHELWQHPMFNLVQWRESFQVWLHSINSEKTENVTLLLTVPLFFQESRGVETVTIYITPTIIFISNKKSKAPYTTQNSVVDICKLLWWRLALGLLLASRPCGLLEKQMVSDVFTINLHASNAFGTIMGDVNVTI